MRQFNLIPAYYEWHLIDDETHETLHNLIDPADVLYHEDSTPKSLDECEEKRLDQIEEIPAAAKVIAETLYNYYIA